MSVRIGDPMPRPDGREKVTGRAKYAADQFLPGRVFAVCVTASIPSGRVIAIDAAPALAIPGTIRVLTHHDMPRLATAPVPPLSSRFIPMQSDEVRHDGQPVAIVVAQSLEAAEHAARLVRVQSESTSFTTWERAAIEDPSPESGYVFAHLDFKKGDTSAGLAAAAFRFDATYTQPSRHHNAMEPSATLAHWEGDRLTMYDATQHGYGVQFVLATLFDVPAEHVRVICPHTGGGFGSKGYIWPHQILAAAAARIIGRPVKLVLTRSQVYTNVGYQPQMTQTMTLGADASGKLTALRHEVVGLSSVSDDFVEFATEASKGLYATPTMHLRQRIRHAHVNTPTALRAPVEGPGTWALESAMDELAHTLQMDPLDLRITNYALVDPADDRPWSSKKLLEAYEEGATLFRWRERSRHPHPVHDGHWLVGTGMASCMMGAFRFPSKARVRLRADGTAQIAASFHDIGTGTLTIFPQIASEVLGIDPAAIAVEHGDTVLPQAGPTYGSSSTGGVGAAVLYGALSIRSQLASLAGLSPESLTLREGRIVCPDSALDAIPITDLMRRINVAELIGDGEFRLPNNAAFEANGVGTTNSMKTFGAVFVEVAVDPALGLLRLRRVVGSYSVGRIINPRTARAQMIGGIIWGWGMAAMEASAYEPTLGRWLAKNLSGVEIPVNADIPGDITIHFVDEIDPYAGPLGAKGIGELGATGVAAAVANAVFDATGRRVRTLPITPDKLV
jgi:xanthine dehydrogenase YagR molybdenum-binding subunit